MDTTKQIRVLVVSDDRSTLLYLKRRLAAYSEVVEANFFDGLALHAVCGHIIIEHSATFDAFDFMQHLRRAGVKVRCTVLVRFESDKGLQGFLPADFLHSVFEKYIFAPSLHTVTSFF